jgi:hypothetical protein
VYGGEVDSRHAFEHFARKVQRRADTVEAKFSFPGLVLAKAISSATVLRGRLLRTHSKLEK